MHQRRASHPAAQVLGANPGRRWRKVTLEGKAGDTPANHMEELSLSIQKATGSHRRVYRGLSALCQQASFICPLFSVPVTFSMSPSQIKQMSALASPLPITSQFRCPSVPACPNSFLSGLYNFILHSPAQRLSMVLSATWNEPGPDADL